MHVEQRHVTTVNLQDGKARDFVVYRDPRGCKVSCITRDEVLNVLLSYQDFQRLCQTLAQPNGGEPARHSRGPAAEATPVAPPATATGSSICVERRQVTTAARFDRLVLVVVLAYWLLTGLGLRALAE